MPVDAILEYVVLRCRWSSKHKSPCSTKPDQPLIRLFVSLQLQVNRQLQLRLVVEVSCCRWRTRQVHGGIDSEGVIAGAEWVHARRLVAGGRG